MTRDQFIEHCRSTCARMGSMVRFKESDIFAFGGYIFLRNIYQKEDVGRYIKRRDGSRRWRKRVKWVKKSIVHRNVIIASLGMPIESRISILVPELVQRYDGADDGPVGIQGK